MWRYDVYYDGGWIHEDVAFETEEDAMDDARIYIESKIDDWEADEIEYEDLFRIEVYEQ